MKPERFFFLGIDELLVCDMNRTEMKLQLIKRIYIT